MRVEMERLVRADRVLDARDRRQRRPAAGRDEDVLGAERLSPTATVCASTSRARPSIRCTPASSSSRAYTPFRRAISTSLLRISVRQSCAAAAASSRSRPRPRRRAGTRRVHEQLLRDAAEVHAGAAERPPRRPRRARRSAPTSGSRDPPEPAPITTRSKSYMAPTMPRLRSV